MSDREQVQRLLQVRHLEAKEIGTQLRIPAGVWANFLKGEDLPDQFIETVHQWVERQPPWTEEEVKRQGEPQLSRELPASVEAMTFVRQVCGVGEDDIPSLDQFLEAFSATAVLGKAETLQQLEVQCPNQQGERLTLEDISQRFLDLQEGHERQMHRMTQRSVVKETVSHSIDQCAAALLSCCPPQVIESMEMASHDRDEPPWKVIAGTLVMWRRDLLGADTTEVGPPGSSSMAVGRQLWSPRAALEQQRGISMMNQPLCEICGKPFMPDTIHHRARFGCPACGDVWNTKEKNKIERERRNGIEGATMSLQPETLEHAMYVKGMGPCTCGQDASHVA